MNKENTIKKEQKKVLKRRFDGIVVSDKMEKTITVRVDQVKIHPKYKKRYTASKKYKAHDGQNKFKVDDKVVIEECRPISKDKKWRVIYN